MPKKKSSRQRKPSAKAREADPPPPPPAAAAAAVAAPAASSAAPAVSARGKSYTMVEDLNMLKHMAAQEKVPASFTAWETIAFLHEADGFERTPESLRKRFATLSTVRRSRPATPTVRRT